LCGFVCSVWFGVLIFFCSVRGPIQGLGNVFNEKISKYYLLFPEDQPASNIKNRKHQLNSHYLHPVGDRGYLSLSEEESRILFLETLTL
jgi:hypothetical protein